MNTRQTAILVSAISTFGAMMAANAAEDTAPQNGVYGMLSDALVATFRVFYAADDDVAVRDAAATHADAAYHAAISSGEVTALTVALPEPPAAPEQTMLVTARSLSNGDTIVDAAGNLRVSAAHYAAGVKSVTVTDLDTAWTQRWSFDAADLVRVVCG